MGARRKTIDDATWVRSCASAEGAEGTGGASLLTELPKVMWRAAKTSDKRCITSCQHGTHGAGERGGQGGMGLTHQGSRVPLASQAACSPRWAAAWEQRVQRMGGGVPVSDAAALTSDSYPPAACASS
jgi:hypothetical protein